MILCRLYYRRVEEGKQYPVLCRRLASLNEEFISHKSPSAGFDFISGKRIEQKLLDYNQEAERFGGIFGFSVWFHRKQKENWENKEKLRIY